MSKGHSLLNAVAGAMDPTNRPRQQMQAQDQPDSSDPDGQDESGSDEQGQQDVGSMTVDQLKGVICDECHEALSSALGGQQSPSTDPQGQ